MSMYEEKTYLTYLYMKAGVLSESVLAAYTNGHTDGGRNTHKKKQQRKRQNNALQNGNFIPK